MTDKEYEKQIVKLFDIFGQALYLTLRAADNPDRDGALNSMKAQWRNVGKQVIKLAREHD